MTRLPSPRTLGTRPTFAPTTGGTLTEMGMAWIHHRLIIALKADGWSGKLAGTIIDDRVRFATIPEDRVYSAETPADAPWRETVEAALAGMSAEGAAPPAQAEAPVTKMHNASKAKT